MTTLPGGLRVATCEMPHAETVSIGIWAGVGGRHEPLRLNGISHFIEHMLFKGTRRRGARGIMEAVEGVGGDMNAYTAEECTCYYATAAAEFFPRICDVLCDIYLRAKFAPTDIERERGVIAEEILMYQDEPPSRAQELLNLHFWPDHPLGRPLTGTRESIQGFTRQDFLDYLGAHYHAGTTVVSAAGRIPHEEVLACVRPLARELPAGRPPRCQRARTSPAGLRVIAEPREIQQTQVAIGLPAPARRDPSRFAVHLLHILLGGNASSRLFQQLREQRGLCYSVGTHLSHFHDTGQFTLSLGLDRGNLRKSLTLIRSAISRLQTTPPRPAELRRAKEYAIGTSRMALERPSAQSARMGSAILSYGKIVDPEAIHEELRRVTAGEVSQAAQDCLRWDRATIAIVGPDPETQMVLDTLGH